MISVVVGSGYDVFARRYSAAGVAQGAEFRVNTYTPGSQRFPSVAANATGFVIAWSSYDQDGSGGGVFAKRYEASGAPGDEFRVNSYTTGNQLTPKVALDVRGDFVVVWTSNGQVEISGDVFGQRFSPDVIFRDGFDGGAFLAVSASRSTLIEP